MPRHWTNRRDSRKVTMRVDETPAFVICELGDVAAGDNRADTETSRLRESVKVLVSMSQSCLQVAVPLAY